MKRDSIITIALCGILVTLIIFSTNAKQGAAIGLSLCESIIIPSLLPILIITNTIIKSRCAIVIEKFFGKMTEKILHLPKCTSTAIIFGLIGGYPAGAILTEQLHKSGKIDSNQAKTIMRYNFCGGIAFLITAIGTIHLGSTKTGAILFASSIVSSFIIAIVMPTHTDTQANSQNDTALSLDNALVEAVDTTTHSIILMCAYIILFSAIINIVPIPQLISPLIEITNGTMQNKLNVPLPLMSFYLAFGGLCIHFQIIGMLKSIKMRYGEFFVFRILHSALSSMITAIICHFFPQSDSVFSNIATKTVEISQVNTGLSIIMIIGCAVIIFDIENKKYKLI